MSIESGSLRTPALVLMTLAARVRASKSCYGGIAMRRIACSVAATVCLYAGAALAAPLDYLALYTFDSGTAADSSANGNDGTVVGGVSFVTDPVRGAVAEFSAVSGANGINTGININPAALPAVTFGGWFLHFDYGFVSKTMSHDDGGFDRTLGLDFRGGTTNEVSAFTGTGVLGSGFVPTLGDWYHAAVSYTGTTVSLFVNGALVATAGDNTGSSTFNLFLGVNPGFEEDLIGRMDDAFVYGRALNESEIAAIYRDGFAAAPVPLPATLPMLLLGLAGLAALRSRRRDD